eukprot:GHVP01057714.1.p3 GENE.GHVP01057714.1~~GHVP01057714.1.p3  ORF type:complete len:216 (+),score=59.84 GHVP01057714.1:51-698(+)
MEFVKTGTFRQVITSDESREEEVPSTGPAEEFNQKEFLKTLPEFRIDPNFKSLSEQLRENQDKSALNDALYSNATICNVTEDDELHIKQETERKLRERHRIKEEEDRELSNFRGLQKAVELKILGSKDEARAESELLSDWNEAKLEIDDTEELKTVVRSSMPWLTKDKRDEVNGSPDPTRKTVKADNSVSFLISKKAKIEEKNCFGLGGYDSSSE